MNRPHARFLQLWGGVECTHNRVGNRRTDQLELSGHATRISDLDRIASLGLRAVRFPALWERVVRCEDALPDWSWTDERLARLAELCIEPVIGLLHHGAGPGDDGFLDPRFPRRFADYARMFAERYPWVTMYIPINEPLTTARFCGLYGFWHPHGTDHETCARILINQIKATILAVRDIKDVNPGARFIQNEDLGTVLSTPKLANQAAFENERRWSTFDLLTGRLRPDDVMWRYLVASGIGVEEIEDIVGEPCRPDVLGIDHYITSDRLLDERMELYPEEFHGGNGEEEYADVIAVRAAKHAPVGVMPLMREAWRRYDRLPLALTEAHIGCTRDEHLRWLDEYWRNAQEARREGIEVESVTVWSLFGAYDWNSLMRRRDGFYEPGAFDLRSPQPRETAVAGMIRMLTNTGSFDHPVLDTEGWWNRPERLFHAEVPTDNVTGGARLRPRTSDPRRIVVVGTEDALLDDLERICDVRNLEIVAVAGADISSALKSFEPWAVIGWSPCSWSLLPSEARPTTSATVDHWREIATPLAATPAQVLYLSCSHVFSPRTEDAYTEADGTRPSTACGTLAGAVETIVQGIERALIVRTGPLFGPWARSGELSRAITSGHRRCTPPSEHVSMSPTYVPDLLNTALDLLIDGETGIWHVVNQGSVTPRGFFDVASTLSTDPKAVVAMEEGDRTMALGTTRGALMPSLRDAILRYLAEAPEASNVGADATGAPAGPDFQVPAGAPTSTLTDATTSDGNQASRRAFRGGSRGDTNVGQERS